VSGPEKEDNKVNKKKESDGYISPVVSIIVRTCNRPKLLKKALKSIVDQTWKKIEVVVVNDGREPLDEIISDLCSSLEKINIIEHKSPQGRSMAANTGLENATGDYICFLDDDDLLLPAHIESLVDTLEQDRSIDVAYTGVQCIDMSGKEIEKVFSDPFDLIRLKAGNYIPFNSIMFRSSLLKKGVRVDETIDLYEDWDFLLQLLDYSDFKYIDTKSALYRIAGDSGFGVSGDSDQVEKAAQVILNKWRNRWSASDLREMTKRAWQFGDMQKQLHDYGHRESSYQKQLHDYGHRESSYQKQLHDYRDRESSYQKHQKEISEKLQNKSAQIAKQELLINQLISSYSWRITAPLRSVNLAVKNKKIFIKSVGVLQRVLKLIKFKKNRIKHTIYDKTAKKTYSYSSVVKPVPRLKADVLNNAPVKVIAFYLPQFHPIPENDKWWGQGFTEWTNVKPAAPQFEGHYQPHIPGELGYYDLNNKETQKKQVEMAKLYGISGFCFYFYWFAGNRLLEQPLLQYLEDSTLDLPFCLAWANENWSRRWDGLDNEILIRQNYSKEDDINFISYLSKYLLDTRYIKINGKPLIIVYRPNLLPSAIKTANRWRKWCRENGIGEVFLAYTQSFEKKAPQEYGFDAAIEFPPNNSEPPNITNKIMNKKKGFAGTIYEWRALVERSFAYNKPEYSIFRGVNPSWDNTPRKKQKGIIFVNSSPFGYLFWLYNALNETINRVTNKDKRIVFVNAWNEWAEGAYIEPDKKYGYAYLEATKMALTKSSLIYSRNLSNPLIKKPGKNKLAIIIHAYYIDMFDELIERIKKLDIRYKIFVTTTIEHKERVNSVLSELGCPYTVLIVKNHGRDVLPFLRIIKLVIKEEYQYFLKLHTKKSSHRKDGDIWRNDLYNKLVNSEKLKSIIKSCDTDKNIGMIGPSSHIVHMTTYLGSNENRVKWYSERMGLSFSEVLEIPFVAGTMFFARMESIIPLLCLAINEDEFEKENGQVDGTLAHAIERLFSISAVSTGLRVIDTDNITNIENKIYINDDYEFVD
jgi:lipopolysaccharide biosynthesis protein/glycosyltransferase involved in cell wall biosynthesis